jgi:hypothetical protein
MADDRDDKVPRIGRGPFFKGLDGADLVKALMLLMLLVAIVLLRRSCAEGVGKGFDVVAPPSGVGTQPEGRAP